MTHYKCNLRVQYVDTRNISITNNTLKYLYVRIFSLDCMMPLLRSKHLEVHIYICTL
jgi:hypothetical protein